MRPVRIEMEGFGAFRDRTIVELGEVELFALVGATGSGKSTIIDAITFALYGAVARYDDNKRVEFVINQLGTEAKVALEFEIGNERYTAVRVVRRTARGATTKEARLERGETILCDSARDMRAIVTELLGLDVDQFNRTVVLPQGRFADFLHDDPAQRQATLRKLLGLDLYSRIGVAARELRARCAASLETLRGEVAAELDEFTDERRTELMQRLETIGAARLSFSATRDSYRSLTELREQLRSSSAGLTASIGMLAGIEVPHGLDTVIQQHRECVQQRELMVAAHTQSEEARRQARAAVADGPDLSAVTLLIEQHEQRSKLITQIDDSNIDIATITHDLAAADEARTQVLEAQDLLDKRAAAARDDLEQVQSGLRDLPTTRELQAWHAAWDAHRSAADRVTELSTQLDDLRPQLELLENTNSEAIAASMAAEEALSEIRDRVGVLGYTHLLHVGAPCPLCQNMVSDVAEHSLDDDLSAAQARFDSAKATAAEAGREFTTAARHMDQLSAALLAAKESASQAESAVADLASVDEIERIRAEHVERAADLDRAAAVSEAATRAAEEHRSADATRLALEEPARIASVLTGKRARLETLISQRDDLDARLDAAPPLPECIQLRDQAVALSRALDELEAEVAAATDRLQTADRELAEVKSAVDAARRELAAARDRVASLGPPTMSDDDLEASWRQLLDWCRAESERLTAELGQLDERLHQCGGEADGLLVGAREAATAATGESAAALEVNQIAELYASAEATARSAVEQFDRDRARIADVQLRIEALAEDEAVAHHLGLLLRSSAFEAWLMQSALEELVERATERLLELSGGQYSLVVDGSEFMVRDHTNADELRSAKTLSGGETFLASLALALALSEATAELAPEGAPPIESIFLDEGFGTLDPDTLDIVATAIEELGATGRMVGIVTHIRDIADRMPVRLEVTKSAGASSVELVEV